MKILIATILSLGILAQMGSGLVSGASKGEYQPSFAATGGNQPGYVITANWPSTDQLPTVQVTNWNAPNIRAYLVASNSVGRSVLVTRELGANFATVEYTDPNGSGTFTVPVTGGSDK